MFHLVVLLIIINPFLNAQNVEVLKYSTTITISRGKLKKEIACELKINNRSGQAYSTIQIPYSDIIKVSNIEASMKDENGDVIRSLKKSDVQDRNSFSNSSFYEESFIKEFSLRHNVYPYILSYSYEIEQDEFLQIANWSPVIDTDLPTHFASLKLIVPNDYEIYYKTQHIGDPIISNEDDETCYTWEAFYEDQIQAESYSPPLSFFVPLVTIVPKNFQFEYEGSFSSWIEYGNWQNKLNLGLDDLPDSEKRKILNIVDGIDDEKEKIRALYHYLQDETRYINVTIETGGLKPYSASYVAENKFGDCKALSNYFKSVLDYVGIESYYSKIYAGSKNYKVDKSFPSQQYNHIILFIPSEKDTLWLDCTSDAAFGYLGTFTQGRNAFIIEKDNSHFVSTPALSFQDVLEKRNICINTNSDLVQIAEFENEYRGDSYEMLLQLKTSYNDADKVRLFKKYFVEEDFQAEGFTIDEMNRDSLTIRLNYIAKSDNIYKKYGNDLLIKNIAFDIPEFEKPEARKLPVQLDFPIYKVDKVSYAIPASYSQYVLPENKLVKTKYGNYEITFDKEEDTIIVSKELKISSGYYDVSEYESFYNFINEIKEYEEKTYVTLN